MKAFLYLLLLYFIAAPAYAQKAKNEIPFELLPSGHILVKANIDGVEGKFIFDTGAGLTLFTKTFADKLPHLVKEDGAYTGFRATGERIDVDLYQVRDFQLGSYRKATEEISYMDVNLGGIDGIISLKLLESVPFTIDQQQQVIRLETPATLQAIHKTASAIPVQQEQSRNKALTLFAYFKVNDTLQLQVSLDSGAGKDVFRLNSRFMNALQVDAGDSTRVKRIEKKSEMNQKFVSNIYLTKLNKIAAAATPAVHTEHFPVQFIDGLIYDGIMWISWLGPKITFDLSKNVLLVGK
ncbi:retropepsin-like aspartic protease [Chitinophaga sp. sic0106]|uniref:retropepsin-like aspartic protease n=1 Tax=Chitinophaga sp. sic0106 TaxID=2854785 RepID=UPI001C480AA1|nr:retropepsin-like aspartic protease [Chitinophaga sp. sic0106]MBV7530847.1 retroviral-like aspartic protease family protein [Chitinophaga sp. sic0106]